jgi:hypothetical protein
VLASVLQHHSQEVFGEALKSVWEHERSDGAALREDGGELVAVLLDSEEDVGEEVGRVGEKSA